METITNIKNQEVIRTNSSLTKEFKETECCLCGKEMEYISGHNAYPISKGHGRCCGTCNYTEVITARLKMMGINN